MNPNHIFIFCENHDEVADELIQFGFKEGSNRIHPNQGTQNRKFYFNDFYLEILWVHNHEEITSSLTSPTQLFERSKYKSNDASPFGLCVNYSKDDDELFNNRLDYKPTYLPKNMVIEVLTNENSTTLPWTFRWKADITNFKNDEPINFHEQKLLKVIFGIKKDKVKNNYLKLFKSNMIFFENSQYEFLRLVFNPIDIKQIKIFESISLIIEF